MAKSLLVIDDSSTIREATQLALTGGEWELVTATNGAEALEALQQHRVDVILCAVAPGEEDGYELCRSLGASAEGSGIPILLMGGNVNATAALAVGASAALPKPFSVEELQQTLQETLEQSDFSFDFDDVPVAVADDAPLELEPLAGGFELPSAEGTDAPLELEPLAGGLELPSAEGTDKPLELEPLAGGFELPSAEGTDESLEFEEIEVIDLGDDDQFDDLELLDDLQPVEFAPAEPAARDDLPAALDFGAAETEDLEDLLAAPAAVAAEEGLDTAPMGFTPNTPPQTATDGQESETEWTVEGLMLGGDEPSPARPEAEFADNLPVDGKEPDPSGDVEPTQPDPFPAPAEKALAEADQTPREDAGGADGGFDTAVEPGPGVLDQVLDESPPGPIQAETFSDLELEWAREAAQAEEDTSPAEEAADSDIALEEILQPAFPEPEAPQDYEPKTPFEYEPEVAGPPPELAWDATDQALEEAVEAFAPATEAGTTPPESSLEADQFSVDEPSAAEISEPAVPVDLAASVAASAGRAVREALEKSLSAEHLAPLVEAAVERVAWEVVPQLAERLIRETIEKLQQKPPTT